VAAQQALAQELDYFGLLTAIFGARPWTDLAMFRPGPAMREGRSECAAVFAGNRVLVFGSDFFGYPLKSTAFLDAQTMAFTAGPNLLARRSGCPAVQLDADRVLVVGGYGDGLLKTTEIFQLSTLTFTPGPNMQSARFGCACGGRLPCQ